MTNFTSSIHHRYYVLMAKFTSSFQKKNNKNNSLKIIPTIYTYMKRDCKTYVIYKIYQTDNPDIIYIGSTVNFSQRKSNHKKNCNNRVSKKYKYPLYQYIRACGGWDSFTIEKVEENPYNSKDEILLREKELIDLLQARLNTIKPIG